MYKKKANSKKVCYNILEGTKGQHFSRIA